MEDVKKYLSLIGEELEEPNNLSKDWVQLLTEMQKMLTEKQAGRMILLPEQGQKLYWIGSCDCERCPAKSGCTEMRGLERCPDYIGADVWKWDESQSAGTDSQLEYFLDGTYLLTREAAVEALKKERELWCADCDFWSYADPRCMCGESPWGGTRTRPDHRCRHLVPRREEQHE